MINLCGRTKTEKTKKKMVVGQGRGSLQPQNSRLRTVNLAPENGDFFHAATAVTLSSLRHARVRISVGKPRGRTNARRASLAPLYTPSTFLIIDSSFVERPRMDIAHSKTTRRAGGIHLHRAHYHLCSFRCCYSSALVFIYKRVDRGEF